jgi:two-component system, probable response regulator PhcQ
MKATVLFVDDEPLLLSGLSRLLRNEPFEIATASSGAAALSYVAQNRVDAVVSDFEMPGMNGVELLSRVRELAPTSVRMMLTGRPTLELAIAALHRGEIQRFFTKPCNSAELSTSLHRALREKELLESARKLLVELQRKDAVLSELERRHPGVTQVATDSDGCIVLEDAPTDLDGLIDAMSRWTA